MARKNWRLFLGIAVVILAIVAIILTSSPAIHLGIVLFVFFLIIVLVISGNRPGGGGVDPHRYQSGNTGNGA